MASFAVKAETAWDIGPLAEVDEISVSVTVGSTTVIESQKATPLFDGESNTHSMFKEALLSQSELLLEQAGIRVTSKAEVQLDFMFFGGEFESSGTPGNFFLIQTMVFTADDDDCAYETSSMGYASDRDLDEVLTNEALSTLRRFIDSRARYRRSVEP